MIDTLASLKQLVAAGMEETQAEAVVKVVNADKGQLATKADLEALRSATKADIAALRSELKQFATKNDMLLLAGFQVAVISLAVAIIKLF
jgi:uncharacterized membrane protein